MSVKEKGVRNLTKTLAMLSLLTPVVGYPLGIGDIKLHSALNQNLNAEIPLTLSAGENAADIKVGLAPAAKFDEAGVPWTYFLSKIKFQTVTKPNGSVVVKLSSREALKEPFLNLLVEVSWPKGNLYREFTVLVDPPSSYQAPAPAVEPVAPNKQALATTKPVVPASAIVPPVNKTPEPATTKPTVATPPPVNVLPSNIPTPTASSSSVDSTATYTVHPKETMWSIGVKFSKGKGVSVEQMLMAIYDANPDTFERNNLFGLRTGTVLHIPDVSAAQKLTADEAKQAYEVQKKAWRSGATLPGPSAVPVTTAQTPVAATAPAPAPIIEKTPITKAPISFSDDSTNKKLPAETIVKPTTAMPVAKVPETKPEVKPPVAPFAPVTPITVAPSANVTKTPEVVKETNENNQLVEEVAQLKKQLKATEKALANTKKEIAEIKKSGELSSASSVVSAETPVTPAPEIKQPKPLAEINPAITLGTVNPPAEQLQPTVQISGGVEPIAPAQPQTPVQPQAPAQPQTPVQPQVPAQPQTPTTENIPEKKPLVSVDKSISLTMVKPAAPIILKNATVVPLAEMSVITGTPKITSPKSVQPQVSVQPPAQQPIAQQPPAQQPVIEEEEEGIDPFYLTLGGAGTLLVIGLGGLWWRKRKQAIEESWYEPQPFNIKKVSTEAESNITSLIAEPAKFEGPSIFDDGSWAIDVEPVEEIDPISEADVYLAYARYQQAEELMRDAIKEHPDRDECKLKLLEIFYASENKEAFEEYALELAKVGKRKDQDFWEKVMEMGSEICPDSAIFTAKDNELDAAISKATQKSAQEFEPETKTSDKTAAVGAEDFDTFDFEDFELTDEDKTSTVQKQNVETFDFDNTAKHQKTNVVADEFENFDTDSFAIEQTAISKTSVDETFDFDDTTLDTTTEHQTDEFADVDFDSFTTSKTTQISDEFDLDNFAMDQQLTDSVQSKTEKDLETFDFDEFSAESLATPEKPTTPKDLETFDFDEFSAESLATPEKPTTPEDLETFDFDSFSETYKAQDSVDQLTDEFDMLGLDVGSSSAKPEISVEDKSKTPSSLDDEFDMLGLDATTSSTKPETSVEDEFDMLGLDATPSSAKPETSLEDEFATLDFADFATEDKSKTPSSVEDEFDMLGFDLDATSSSAKPETSLEDEFANLDFADFGTEDKSKTPSSLDDEFDMLGFDLDTTSSSTKLETSLEDEFATLDFATENKNVDSKVTSIDATKDEFDFDNLGTVTPTSEETFDFDLPASSAEKKNTESVDFDFDFDLPSSDEEGFAIPSLADMDDMETQLDLAKAYIEMGDTESAKNIAEEVFKNGTDAQKKVAESILQRLK